MKPYYASKSVFVNPLDSSLTARLQMERFYAFQSELFHLAENNTKREHILGKFYHTETLSEFYMERRVPGSLVPWLWKNGAKILFDWFSVRRKVGRISYHCEDLMRKHVSPMEQRRFSFFLTVGFQLSSVFFWMLFLLQVFTPYSKLVIQIWRENPKGQALQLHCSDQVEVTYLYILELIYVFFITHTFILPSVYVYVY